MVLDTRPTANVTVTVAGHGGTDVTLTPSILTFTTANWNLAQTVTVKAGNDTDTTNDTVTLTHSAASTDSNYGGITIGSVVVTVADNDSLTGAPTGLRGPARRAPAPRDRQRAVPIDLSWTAPASTGGSAITGYKIEVSPNGTSGWTDQVANTNSTATTYAHTGLADRRHPPLPRLRHQRRGHLRRLRQRRRPPPPPPTPPRRARPRLPARRRSGSRWPLTSRALPTPTG